MSSDTPDPGLSYRDILGKTQGLQRGFTSGTCAAAAAKGAFLLLLGKLNAGQDSALVTVQLNRGPDLPLPVESLVLEDGAARCCIIKDSGDDDDVTHGQLFCARVSWRNEEGIAVEGGPGIGKVSRSGLPVKPGEWAINPGPRRMIEKNLRPLLPPGKGIFVSLSVPRGEELARKTWNPRLGIEGGISIIGTSGIIEPRSSAAYRASIALVAKMRSGAGDRELFITPGYVGESYYKRVLSLADDQILRFGDHAGFALLQGARRGFQRVHLAAHVGKMAKIAAGLFDTHSKNGDARLETVAALAGAAGAGRELIRSLLGLRMAEEAVGLLQEAGLEETFQLMAERAGDRIFALWAKDFDTFPKLRLSVLDLEGRRLNSCPDCCPKV